MPLAPIVQSVATLPPSLHAAPIFSAPGTHPVTVPSNILALHASSSRAPMRTTTEMEPVFYSHISQVFTAQMALEEQLREANRKKDAMRLETKQKVQQTVFVYAWIEENVVPALFEIQDGFIWPHFMLNEAVLVAAGFPDIPADMRFNLFRFNLGHWTTIKINHVVELKEPHIFIKALNVQLCRDFSKYHTSMISSVTPNIRSNLAGERAHVKKKMVARELSVSSGTQLALPNKRRLSPESLPSTPKRSRFLFDASPTPTISRHHNTLTSSTPLRQESIETYDSDSDSDQFFLDSPKRTLFREHPVPSSHLQPSNRDKPTDPVLPFYLPPTRASKKPRWPADFFAVDVAGCFDEVEDGAADAKVCSIFEAHFRQWVLYKKSTFYEHRQRWEAASLEAKHAVLSAGRTPAGCWIHVMSTTPGPRARVKAARKASSQKSSGNGVIELSSDTDTRV
ncbi:hypothetical protein BJ912DRAFT_928336 [Pholiota molesta]|nr:hypothetical protein BJ912DRAFT_928336 [Pholiota molesta]